MLRELGIFEKAVLVSNNHAAFHINAVLSLKNPPAPEKVESAMNILQTRHPLLRARIRLIGKNHIYMDTGDHSFPFQVIERTNDRQWLELTESEMARKIQVPQDALFRITYLYQQEFGDLIFVFHHAIADAVSSSNLFDELLRILADERHPTSNLSVLPKVEDKAPKEFIGLKKIINLMPFGFRQLSQEMSFQLNTLGKRKPPVRLGGNGRIMTFSIPEEVANSLAFLGRKKNLTLNSILNAAQLLAINRILYHGKPTPMYTMSFANLRPHTVPPTSVEDLGSYISMIRVPLKVEGSSNLWNLSLKLHEEFQKTFKNSDKFSSYFFSEIMLKMITAFKSMRFGSAALNYNSTLNLKENYGSIELLSVHGFVSGFDLGPEIGSQVRIFRDQLVWDFTYLDTDYNLNIATQISNQITKILELAIVSN